MTDQLSLFDSDETPKITKLGKAEIQYAPASAILTPASGFVESYDYTLNPYSGCAFGCTYCYAAFFSRNKELQDQWGQWVKVKENGIELLRKKRRSSLEGKSIYMSSVTDPYQPIERELEFSRDLLEALVPFQPRIVIQTRSPLITRDIDILQRFEVVQVNMTVTTDSEKVRKAFEPMCPGNLQRLRAIAEIASAEVGSCITMTPLLPIENPETFASSLIDTGVEKFIIQPFHASSKSRFVAGTRDRALELQREMNWTPESYEETLEVLKRKLPNLGEGKEGFSSI
ncbi:radical SAM protein [Verrucomicrobia bacterium]|nr:radical SAM protein [Verrucomicrobiota bacterium]